MDPNIKVRESLNGNLCVYKVKEKEVKGKVTPEVIVETVQMNNAVSQPIDEVQEAENGSILN